MAEVPAEEIVKHSFYFIHRVVKVRLLQSDGKTPIANTHCVVSGDRHGRAHTTDAAGWLTLDPGPYGKLSVSVGGFKTTRMIEVPEADDPVAAIAKMPVQEPVQTGQRVQVVPIPSGWRDRSAISALSSPGRCVIQSITTS